MGIKHTKVSAVSDGADTTKVRPTDWNTDHTIDGDVNFQGFDILNCGNIVTGESTSEFFGWVTPQQFGLDEDTSNLEITQADIDAHPEWIGTYPVGVFWDVVAIQEAIYEAYASKQSTPGNLVWNSIAGWERYNKVFYCPPMPFGYALNHPIFLVAEQFEFRCASRGASKWYNYGGIVLTGNSHSNTTIDNLDPALVARLSADMINGTWVAIRGEGLAEGTYVVSASGTSITIGNASSSTVVGASFYVWWPCFICDSVAYGTFRNVTIEQWNPLPRWRETDDTGNWFDNPSRMALWVLDGSGTFGGLKTQQITIYDPVLFGADWGDVGMAISPSGGTAQGDTITIVNPYISHCNRAAIQISGNNALSIQVINGDIQACAHHGIVVHSGSVYVDGTSFQANATGGVNSSPQVGQHQSFGSDVYLGAGGGSTSTGQIENVRSEASVAVVSTNLGGAHNVACAGSDASDWFANFPFMRGALITPTSNNALGRSFLCVDAGGPNAWRHVVPTGISANTITDAGSPGYVVNAYVGSTLFIRFGSSGFTSHFTGGITANTASAITWTGTAVAPTETMLYQIGGYTAGSAPSFDSKAEGGIVFPPAGSGQGFFLTGGSTTVTIGSGLSSVIAIGDYIVIPGGDRLGPEVTVEPDGFIDRRPPIDCVYVAKVLNKVGLTLTMDAAPFHTLTEAGGYYGTGFTDNTQTWLAIGGAATFRGLNRIERCVGNYTKVAHADGVLGGPVSLSEFNSSGTDNSGSLVSGQIMTKQTGALDASTTPLDLTNYMGAGNYSTLTPTQSMTLNAATPLSGISQEWTLLITTSGVSSYTITFGTNFKSSGTLATGVVTAKKFLLRFISDGTSWCELSRTGAL